MCLFANARRRVKIMAKQISMRNHRIDPERHYTEKEAATLIYQADVTLRTWRCEKKGPAYYKLGRAVTYLGADLIAWREAQRVDPAKAAA